MAKKREHRKRVADMERWRVEAEQQAEAEAVADAKADNYWGFCV